jgi:DNA-binding NarL/FixJ family response regulator
MTTHRPPAVERVMFLPKQRRVLELLREAKSAKEIATALNLSTSSVYWHMSSLCRQIGIPVDRGALIKWCCDHGEYVERGIALRVPGGGTKAA